MVDEVAHPHLIKNKRRKEASVAKHQKFSKREIDVNGSMVDASVVTVFIQSEKVSTI